MGKFICINGVRRRYVAVAMDMYLSDYSDYFLTYKDCYCRNCCLVWF
jgi:hypothetical protein